MQPSLNSHLAWTDRPLTELLRLAWPMVVQLLSVSMMTFVDTLFIARLGWVELAAAGLGGMCTFTVLSFGVSIYSAARVEVSRLHGRGDALGVRRALGAFLRLAVWLGAFSLLAGLIAAWALPLIAADAPTGALGARYTALRSLGFAFAIVASAIGQWLSAQGDSKSAMRAALYANVANVPLNAALIFGLGWGIEGAAIASALASVVEAVYLLRLQTRRGIALEGGGSTVPGLHLELAVRSDSWLTLRRGLPTGLERVLDMMAFAAVPVLLARVGPVHVAAHQVVLQLMLISFLPTIALSDAVSVLVAQALGAERPVLVRRVCWLGLGVGVGYALGCGAVYLGFGSRLLGIFSPDAALFQAALPALFYGALLQLLNAGYNHYKGLLRGLSDFRFVAWVAVGCAWLLTPPLTYAWGLVQGRGVEGAWMALCVEVVVGAVLCAVRAHRHVALAAGANGLAWPVVGRSTR